jgi:hypothetical protein
LTFVATDNVGVTLTDVSLDGKRLADAYSGGCFVGEANTARQPCAGRDLKISIQVSLESSAYGAHALALRAYDVSGNTSTRTISVLVDRHAPAPPTGLRIEGPQGWTSENVFDVAWTAPESDGFAPITRVGWELCPLADDATSQCVSGEQDNPSSSVLRRLAAPRSGEWKVRLALRDEAGNLDWKNSASAGVYRFDGDPPDIQLLPFAPEDPSLVRVAVTDAMSGVDQVEIEARRQGDTVWNALRVGGADGSYVGTLDDDHLAAGTYELRARATDHAGNERTTNRTGAGAAMTARLPLRLSSVLVVGHPRRVRVATSKSKKPQVRTVLEPHARLPFGRRVDLEGRLTDPNGRPLADAQIRVSEFVRLPGRVQDEKGTIRTGADGRFRYSAAPGPTRTLRFDYEGSSTSRAATKDVELVVNAGITLDPSRRSLRNGEAVVFRGRLLGSPVPRGGKLLMLQAKTVRGWRTFATPRARAGNGRYEAHYRFTATQATVRYAFRVVVPEDLSYPYARSTSRTATVLVHGTP